MRILLLTLVLFLYGCSANTEIGTEYSTPEAIVRKGSTKVYRRSEIESKPTSKPRRTKSATKDTERSLTAAERAKKLSGLITNIKGVEEATVVVTGNTAIVGLKPTGHLDDMMLLKLKKEIDDLVKADDEKIKNVAITARPELVSRVSRMSSAETSRNIKTNTEVKDL